MKIQIFILAANGGLSTYCSVGLFFLPLLNISVQQRRSTPLYYELECIELVLTPTERLLLLVLQELVRSRCHNNLLAG